MNEVRREVGYQLDWHTDMSEAEIGHGKVKTFDILGDTVNSKTWIPS